MAGHSEPGPRGPLGRLSTARYSNSRLRAAGRFAPSVLGVVCLALLLVSCSDNPSEPGPAFTLDTLQVSADEFPYAPRIPPDNPVTRQGVRLGRMLFYDPILSGDSTQACASCHAQTFGFSDHGRRFSVGIDGIEGNRNAPAVMNEAWNFAGFFWDARARSPEAQALQPVPNPIEMHLEWTEAEEKLRRHPDYPDLFFEAFGDREITADRVVKAIGQFERTLISNDSKFDKWTRGEVELTPSETAGFEIFFTEVGDCFHCHTLGLFHDNDFHDIGLDSDPPDPGVGAITKNPADMGKFKTPTLRNVEVTAPYMHDGRFETLDEVLDHYNGNAVSSANVDPLIRVGVGLGLTEEQKQDVISFLKTLTDSTFLHNPDFSNPFE